jgi:polysaccharide export outer membrane protein
MQSSIGTLPPHVFLAALASLSARLRVGLQVGMAALTVVTGLGGCATGGGNYDYTKEPDPRSQEYIIGVSDRVKVNVWRDADLSVETKVRPDGTITIPLLGDVRAAGRTPSQIRREVTEKLSALYKSETLNVTVAVIEALSYAFTISGNAEKPGRYTADNYITVLEAIALAGGPNRYAETKRLMVLRRDAGSGGTKHIPIDYDKLRTGERLDQNIVVLSGDVILIP